MSFDWNIWAKNFPVSYGVEEPIEKANMPLRVTISRAGQSVSLSPDELREVLRGLEETRLPWSAGEVEAYAGTPMYYFEDDDL